MRYLITISYDGSKYCGFQRQKKDKGIQNEIETALKKVTKKEIKIKGAGRTDRGVHAYAQKCHFDLDTNIEVNKLRIALNDQLSKYIYIKDCIIVDDDFHARFNVLEKEYIYKINLGEYDPMLEDYTYQIKDKLNLNMMKKVSKLFIGKNDFSSFVSGEEKSSVTTIKSIKFSQYGNILYIKIKGTHFYRYMIRNIIGALIEAGKGKVNLQQIKELIDNPSKKVILPTAIPSGLYLFDIKY